jgi:hypothetical protein
LENKLQSVADEVLFRFDQRQANCIYILVVAMYLGGASWGPQVVMQEFTSEETCQRGIIIMNETVNEMNKTNLRDGNTLREISKATCTKKSGYLSDGEPGAKTLWIGLQRTMDAASTIQALRMEDA